MSYYKKLPVLDEKEQAEFDKYLTEQYRKDLDQAVTIAREFWASKGEHISPNGTLYMQIFDKLATPRIYLLQAWIHRRQQEEAGVLEKKC